jgi:hypothetical protein
VNQLTHALKKARYDPNARLQQTVDIASNRERGTMPTNNRILICAALTTGLLLQGSSCFGDDRTKLTGTWKLVAFMTEDINNTVRENVYDEQAEGGATPTRPSLHVPKEPDAVAAGSCEAPVAQAPAIGAQGRSAADRLGG